MSVAYLMPWRQMALAGLAGLAMVLASPASAQKDAGCDAVAFWDANFQGPSMRLSGDVEFVGPRWNDQISSIQIFAGVWEFYWDAGFRGAVLRLGPGNHAFVGPRWNDQISSMRCQPS